MEQKAFHGHLHPTFWYIHPKSSLSRSLLLMDFDSWEYWLWKKWWKEKGLSVWFGRLGTHRWFYEPVTARVCVLEGLAKDQENLEKSHFVILLYIIMKHNYYQEILAPISHSNGFLEVYLFAFSFPLFVWRISTGSISFLLHILVIFFSFLCCYFHTCTFLKNHLVYLIIIF